MRSLVLAVLYFLGIHFFISGTRLRKVIVARVGEQGFLALFSALSLAGMFWMIWAYAAADDVVVWVPAPALRWLAAPLTLIAFLFVVIGLMTPNPTVVGGEAMLDSKSSPEGMLRITRHPFLWGVALWALTHLLVNGDAASMILFGSLLVLAAAGPFLIDAKRRERLEDKWRPFAAATSNVPFVAIAQGRNELRLNEIAVTPIAIALAVWVAMILAHPWLFGVRALPV